MILYNSVPELDLHGTDREYAKLLIEEFIHDQYKMKNERVKIIHGIGTGIIKKTTQDVLKKNKLVEEYKIDFFNPGTTLVQIKKNN